MGTQPSAWKSGVSTHSRVILHVSSQDPTTPARSLRALLLGSQQAPSSPRAAPDTRPYAERPPCPSTAPRPSPRRKPLPAERPGLHEPAGPVPLPRPVPPSRARSATPRALFRHPFILQGNAGKTGAAPAHRLFPSLQAGFWWLSPQGKECPAPLSTGFRWLTLASAGAPVAASPI